MGFIKDLYESKALRNQRGLKNMSAEQVAENIYMNVLSLQAMRHDPNSMKFAQEYAKKTMMNPGFDNIRTTATDLHNWVAVFNQADRYVDKIGPAGRANIPILQFKQYLRQVASGKVNPNFDKQFLMSLERNLGIHNAQYSATRRLLSDWNRLLGSERKLSTTRLLQAIRSKSARSDLRSPYETFVRKGGYELKDVHNSEIAGKTSFGAKAAAAAASGVAGYWLGKKLAKGITGYQDTDFDYTFGAKKK
jgi:hypothetical protein